MKYVLEKCVNQRRHRCEWRTEPLRGMLLLLPGDSFWLMEEQYFCRSTLSSNAAEENERLLLRNGPVPEVEFSSTCFRVFDEPLGLRKLFLALSVDWSSFTPVRDGLLLALDLKKKSFFIFLCVQLESLTEGQEEKSTANSLTLICCGKNKTILTLIRIIKRQNGWTWVIRILIHLILGAKLYH